MEYKLVNKDNKRYIIVPRIMELGLNHCFTTMDMDMSINTNGSIESLKENLNNIYNFLGKKPKILYSGKQVHSSNIEIIKDISQGMTNELGQYIPDTDGLITDKKNIALISRFADCIPILIYDPVKKVHANIHSGWKGTLGGIGIKGIDLLISKFNSRPEDLIVVLGPSISKEDFEVESDVMEMFKTIFEFYNQVITQKNEIKYLIDLKGIYRVLLRDRGILDENIISINLSTYSTEYLHSYRRDKSKFGLMSVVSFL